MRDSLSTDRHPLFDWLDVLVVSLPLVLAVAGVVLGIVEVLG